MKRSSLLLKLSLGLLALILLSPLGLMAEGSAWGEWASEEIKALLGFVPEGFQRLEGLWSSPMANYAFSGWQSSFLKSFGYLLCAALGCASCFLTAFLVGKALSKRKSR